MSEPRKNHLTIDGGQVQQEDNIASYKAIPESDTVLGIEYIEADNEHINQSENMDTDVAEDIDDLWESNSVNILLNLYLQNVDRFRNPKIRKKNVWIDIANEIGKSPIGCDKKFRNLKQTYIRLLKRKNSEGLLNTKWPYFDIFEEIYTVDGELHPEIQQKISDTSSETVAKALLSMSEPSNYKRVKPENGECSSGRNEKVIKRLNRNRYAEFKKVSSEMRERQRIVEEKLDRLINIVEESNNIQKERNRLFEQFLEKLG